MCFWSVLNEQGGEGLIYFPASVDQPHPSVHQFGKLTRAFATTSLTPQPVTDPWTVRNISAINCQPYSVEM